MRNFFCNFTQNFLEMHFYHLSDDEIIAGFRRGDAGIIREYFYEYCRVAYQLFDQRYQLSSKESLDFMSLAHQYFIYLAVHDWKPLEDHSPNVSLRSWFIGGFRYVVLDALKWYKREYGSITFEDYLQTFDVNSDLRLQFNRVVEDICNHAPLSRQERLIIDLMLLKGFKGKEVADLLDITPSAISQKYKQLMERIIVPYFRKNFDMELEMPEVMEMPWGVSLEVECMHDIPQMSEPSRSSFKKGLESDSSIYWDAEFSEEEYKVQKRTTPYYITELQPDERFVFGSNLRGLHGGGTAYIAYSKFGAIIGQGVGLQGQSYAIPTMQGGVETIRPYVNEFIGFAREHQDLTFLVTRIGCGMAGFTDEDISPLFSKAHDVENIVLPPNW